MCKWTWWQRWLPEVTRGWKTRSGLMGSQGALQLHLQGPRRNRLRDRNACPFPPRPKISCSGCQHPARDGLCWTKPVSQATSNCTRGGGGAGPCRGKMPVHFLKTTQGGQRERERGWGTSGRVPLNRAAWGPPRDAVFISFSLCLLSHSQGKA